MYLHLNCWVMSTLPTCSVLILITVATAAAQSCPSCEIGCDVTTCFELQANDLTFHCRRVQDDSDDPARVLLLHGFPEWSHHWLPIMEYWTESATAIDAVACDLRGYSPLASPDIAGEYDYSILQTDIWAIADALGFDTFHLVGHDHGAALRRPTHFTKRSKYILLLFYQSSSVNRAKRISLSGYDVSQQHTLTILPIVFCEPRPTHFTQRFQC